MGEPPSSLGGFQAKQQDSLVISDMSKAAGGPGLSKWHQIMIMKTMKMEMLVFMFLVCYLGLWDIKS